LVQLLRMPVPLHLGLVPVDAPLRLASEGEEVLVDELGCQAVAGMLLGGLDVAVNVMLLLEFLVTTLIRAGEWTLACVVHHVPLEGAGSGEG